MIQIVDKSQCCGCSACEQICHRHCITMQEDKEGFLYPFVDMDKCVDCGLCERVCPMQDTTSKKETLQILASYNPDEDERLLSSSGGIFVALAKTIIKEEGVIFGAIFDKNWEVCHSWTDCIEGIYPMMGSKYLQSRIGNCYQEVASFLKDGRMVMFVGSPCQITGLRTFLKNKVYPNLLTVDFLCHGVPSPGVWRTYLSEVTNRNEDCKVMPPMAAVGENTVLKSSLDSDTPIGDVKFRDKSDGWRKYRFVVRQKSASKADTNSVLLSEMHNDNAFMKGFLSNVYLRPSCYTCKCKNGKSHSDLTIGDYWGSKVADSEMDDDKGLSLVLVNSAKGRSYWEKLDFEGKEVPYSNACVYNGGFSETIWQPYERKKFFKQFMKGKGFYASWAYCNRVSFKHVVKVKLLSVVHKFLK